MNFCPMINLMHFHLFRFVWILLVSLTSVTTISIGIKSLKCYNTNNTVLLMEKDYYFWNTDIDLLDEYSKQNGIEGRDKIEFYECVDGKRNLR